MTTALDSSFFLILEFWIWTNHNSLLSIATNQFASFCIDIRLRQCYFRVSKSGEIWNKKAFLYYIKQIDSMLPCVCSVIDHRGCASCATFLFSPHFDVNCDLLRNRRTATWNLCVNLSTRSFWATGGNRKWIFRMPGQWFLLDFQTNDKIQNSVNVVVWQHR